MSNPKVYKMHPTTSVFCGTQVLSLLLFFGWGQCGSERWHRLCIWRESGLQFLDQLISHHAWLFSENQRTKCPQQKIGVWKKQRDGMQGRILYSQRVRKWLEERLGMERRKKALYSRITQIRIGNQMASCRMMQQTRSRTPRLWKEVHHLIIPVRLVTLCHWTSISPCVNWKKKKIKREESRKRRREQGENKNI